MRGSLDAQIEEYSKEPVYVSIGLALAFVEDVWQEMDLRGWDTEKLAEKAGMLKKNLELVLDADPTLTVYDMAKLATALDKKVAITLEAK